MSTIRERLTAVETRLQDFLKHFNGFQESNKKSHRVIFKKLDILEDAVRENQSQLKIITNLVTNMNPKMSWKEKTAIIVALISGVSAIVVTLIEALA